MNKVTILLAIGALWFSSANAGMVDVSSTASWSYVNTTGSHSLNSAFSGGGQTSPLSFDLSAIPLDAKINSATLTFQYVSTNWNFGFNIPAFGCMPSPGPLTFFGEAIFCSDILGAQFADTVIVDGMPPGFSSLLFTVPPGSPIAVDPSAILANGTYTVDIFSSTTMVFGAFDDFSSGTPPIPSFSINGNTHADLSVDFSPAATPEPASYSLMLIALLPVIGFRRRAQTLPNL